MYGGKYLIIADDFTGANDTGVQLKRRGYATEVVFVKQRKQLNHESLVIDTESRYLEGEKAAEVMRQALEEVDLNAFTYIIKKVDSTLRGNIAEEIRALDRIYGSELVAVAPSLPELGRITEGGIQKLNGRRITQTEIAGDLKRGVEEDNLTVLLGRVYEEDISLVTAGDIKKKNWLSDSRICIFDSSTNDQLKQIVREVKRTKRTVLWVGTSALADTIMELEQKTLPAMGIVGSVSSVTSQQVKAAEKSGTYLVKVPMHQLIAGEKDGECYIEEALQYLKEGRYTILLSSSSYDRGDLELAEAAGRERGWSSCRLGEYVQETLGAMTDRILRQVKVCGIFVTGGDTAVGVLKSISASGSDIQSEIMFGIPMVKIIGGRLNGMKAITKAGAFGSEDAIKFALRKLREREGE